MSIDINQLIQRMTWARDRGLTQLAWRDGGLRVSLQRGPGHAPVPAVTPAAAPAAARAAAAAGGPAAAPAPDAGTLVTAPLAGLCHLAPDSGGAVFVTPGDAVTAGQTLCVIEAMKMMTAVTAPQAGTVAALLVANGAEVAAGTPLVRIAS